MWDSSLLPKIALLNLYYSKFKKPMARLIFIGLEATGKTAAFHNITGQRNYMTTRETVGINTSTFSVRGTGCRSQDISITLVDLGGSEKIRDLWSSQFFDTSGALYFIRDPDTLDLAMQLLLNILTTTSFPLHILINNQEASTASRLEAVIKELLDEHSPSRPLLCCSICDISVRYRKNKTLISIMKSLGLAAHTYYVANREEIILQQRDALMTSFHFNLSTEERRQKLLELRQQNNSMDPQEQDAAETQEAKEIQILTPTMFTTSV